MMLNVYIGYDRNEDAAYRVCEASLRKHATQRINVVKLDIEWLRRIGLYRRQFFVQDGQRYDARDGRPFSTDFSFTRFLVPSLQPGGFAVFCDSDFLWRADVLDLVRGVEGRHPLRVVKHDFCPDEKTKMRGQVQTQYARKNWSSLMVWNCDHPMAKTLTPYMVNTMAGSWLHRFSWLGDEDIGEISERWNWLEGHSSLDIDPAAVHFTRGTPDMPGWDDVAYADEWLKQWAELKQ